MKIRKAKKEDFKELAEILRKESSKKPYTEDYTPKIALEAIKNLSKKDLYVAVDGKELMGFIASNIMPDNKKKAYIDELWLRSKCQGKGVGKILVKFIEDKYKKRGVTMMRLVAKRGAKAFSFYKKIKYKEYKPLVFMEKQLKWKQ